jgi:hypothetical protein
MELAAQHILQHTSAPARKFKERKKESMIITSFHPCLCYRAEIENLLHSWRSMIWEGYMLYSCVLIFV